MSLGPIPQWDQRVFGVLWVCAGGAAVALFAMEPFGSPVSPLPFIWIGVVWVWLVLEARSRLLGMADRANGDCQTDLSRYN